MPRSPAVPRRPGASRAAPAPAAPPPPLVLPETIRESHPHTYAGFRYALDVLEGRIPACKQVVQACRRFADDITASRARRSEWQFLPALAERAMVFAELLPNIKGPAGGTKLRLMDWQRFAFANIFGWVTRGTTTRRFRQAIVYVPRGNGKTTIAAPIALYLTFGEAEPGAEGFAAAVTRDQARILFDTARAMVKSTPEISDPANFGVEAGANFIFQPKTFSKLRPISSDAKALDGLNVAVAVCDEIASHKTAEVYDVLLTAMGKRTHPLLLSISTATGNVAGVGRQLWDWACRVLDGAQREETLFALIYTADPEDDPWSEETWRKANPSWGVAVQPDAIRAIMRQARQNPAQEAAAKTRHLNIWVGADEALFSTQAWLSCSDPGLRLEDLEGSDIHVGLDLAHKTDLAAMAVVVTGRDDEGRPTYKAFARCYLNERAVTDARNPSYPGWAADGSLIITPGNETDYSQIEDDIRDLLERFRVVSIGYDPWQSAMLSQRLRSDGAPMVQFPCNVANLSPAISELDAAMRSGRLQHDGNPVLAWCIGNVVGKEDRRGNLFPTKSRDAKIDAAVALLMAIGRAQASDDGAADIGDFFRDPLYLEA